MAKSFESDKDTAWHYKLTPGHNYLISDGVWDWLGELVSFDYPFASLCRAVRVASTGYYADFTERGQAEHLEIEKIGKGCACVVNCQVKSFQPWLLPLVKETVQ
jgi:hypothetical protein